MRFRASTLTCTCCLASGLFGVCLVRAAEPGTSRLSMHLIAHYTAGAQQIVNAHPRVIKILDTHGSMMSAARAYKSGTPNGRVVLRVYTQKRYTFTDDPIASAGDFWNTVLKPPLSALSAADRALIDYVEGPNECESTPCWGGTLADATWFNNFWVELAQHIAAGGHKPCAFSIPVGNPPGTVTEMFQKLDRIVPALRKCKDLGGAWSYHAYTGPYTTDVSTEIWYSLRYRQFYGHFAVSYPDLLDLPLILTEGGVDTGGNPTSSGWRANGDAAKYQNWLTWYDARLRENPYVLGCTLFQIGDATGWPSFDLEPIAGWLAGYIGASVPPAIQCAPAQFSMSVRIGENAPETTFTVKNSGANALNYAIAEDASWLAAIPAAGVSTGETDTITLTFATAGLVAGEYSALITVVDANATNSPQVLPVALTVFEPPQPGDMEGDRDVEQRDIQLFAPCLTGADSGPPATGCERADFDADGDVDQSDFGILQRCFSGFGVPGDPDCAE